MTEITVHVRQTIAYLEIYLEILKAALGLV